MTGVHHSLNGTQSEVGLSLESFVGQGRQDKVSNGPAEAESDSGDSLFITQKTVTLPEARRSGRRPHYSRRSKPVSPRDLEEGEDSSSSASCDEELKTPNWRRRKKYSLPKYSFPFLQERKLNSGPLPDQNKSLHNYTMGGFFKCLGELRQSYRRGLLSKSYRRGQNLESSLPTVDMDGENISPLSEEDGERSEDEDIKVVERKHFVASSKTQSQQTWCNQLKQQQRRRKNATRKGSEASEPVTGPAGPRPRSQRFHHRLPERTGVTTVKKRRKEESGGLRAAASVNMEAAETPGLSEGCRAAQTSDVLEANRKNGTEDSSGDGNTLRQEEGDIPDSTQKKKRKKNKSRAEIVGQEVDVRVEDSVVSVSCNTVEDGGKKKKKRKISDEDVEQLQSGAVAEPLNDDVDIQKKKKKKKKKEMGIVITEEREEEEASNRTLDLPPGSTEPLEALGNCSENAAASQETLASGFVKRKKHKKKQQPINNDAPQDGEEGVDVSFCPDDSVTLAKGSWTSLKKKKRKSIFEGMSFSSYTPEVKGKFENVYLQKTNEGREEQKAEPVTKKKKKKKSELFSRGLSEDKVAQSNDSASAREKEEKKRKSSFVVVADAEENDVEELDDGVTKQKKKRKRKTSAVQDVVEKGRERDCEEPNETRRGALPQSTDTGRTRKKKRTGSESEGWDGAADAAFSPHDEVLKKKKKTMKKDVMKEGPPTATTCSSVSPKDRAKASHDGSTHDQASTETLTSVERDLVSSETSSDARDKKKKFKNAGKSSTVSAELEPREDKKKQKKERNEQSTTPETSDIVKNKHRKLRRKLHNPNEDLFTDC